MNERERFEELLALRLYGELSDGELQELERALESDPALRGLAMDLDRGLGVLARAARREPAAELPDDWRESLRDAAREGPGPRRLVGGRLQALVGFAAGVLFTWLLLPTSARPAEELAAIPAPRGTAVPFERETEPAPASTSGSLAQLGVYLRR